MFEKSEGIVLHCIKYSETSIITHIYTKDFGICSFIMNNVRGNRSKMAFFQPLSIVSIQFYKKKNEKIHRIKEIGFCEILTNIHTDIYKSTISLFIGDFLYKLCTNTEHNVEFYTFIKTFILYLEQKKELFSNIHILFLVQITRFWGIMPHNNYSVKSPYFDIMKGEFSSIGSEHGVRLYLSEKIHEILNESNFENQIQLSRTEKKELLQIILTYYSIHAHKIELTHSLQILESVFD